MHVVGCTAMNTDFTTSASYNCAQLPAVLHNDQIGDIESEYAATGDVRSAMRQLEALARSASPQTASTASTTGTSAATGAAATSRSQPSSRSRSQSPVPTSATQCGGGAGEVLRYVHAVCFTLHTMSHGTGTSHTTVPVPC
jgi:hypothetical protein